MNQQANLTSEAQRYFFNYTSFQVQRNIFSLSGKRANILNEVMASNDIQLFIDTFDTDNIKIPLGKELVVFDIYKGKIRCQNKRAWKLYCKGSETPECGLSYQIANMLYAWRKGHGTCNAQLYRDLEPYMDRLEQLPEELPTHSGYVMAFKVTPTCKKLYVQDPGHRRTWVIEILTLNRRAYDRHFPWPLLKTIS